MKATLNDIVAFLQDYALGLVPGALGATVAIAVQGAMSWTQRFIQLSVGIIVSYYAGEIAAHFGAEGVVKNAVGFTAGIGAFEVVKQLRVSLGEVAKNAPTDLWNTLKGLIGIRK